MRAAYVFASVAEAKASLAADRLGTIYYSAGKVFVATSHGTGTFKAADWRDGDGPRPSVEGGKA